MKFNIAYFGPEPIFHLRRDFLLALQYGLESLGHDVVLSGLQMDTSRFNLLVGAYFLRKSDLEHINASGVAFAHVNTEVIAGDLLNHDPNKTDFLGAYLPSMRAGRFVWDVILDNLEEHRRYGNNAHFLRWGWEPRLQDIAHREPKDLDFYFFGLMSPRRRAIVEALKQRGFVGLADHSCPYFLRNDRISRARVLLNIVQDEIYTHVNSFRICYLANNGCAILSEAENDPAGYLAHAKVVHRKEELGDAMAEQIAGERWRAQGRAGYELFKATPMKQSLEALLEASFATSAPDTTAAPAAPAVAAGGAR